MVHQSRSSLLFTWNINEMVSGLFASNLRIAAIGFHLSASDTLRPIPNSEPARLPPRRYSRPVPPSTPNRNRPMALV